jgi:hypothetical protein
MPETEVILDICMPEGKTWLARITGPDERWGVVRAFINPVSTSTSKSGRTGQATYLIGPGIYERHEGRRNLAGFNGFFQVTGAGQVVPLNSAAESLNVLAAPAAWPASDPAFRGESGLDGHHAITPDGAFTEPAAATEDQLLAEIASLEDQLDRAHAALQAERFKDVPRYSKGDIILVPRKLFGKITPWAAQIATVHLDYSAGAVRGGKRWETRLVSYSVFLRRPDGTFGGASEGYRHDEVRLAPQEPAEEHHD